jgi:hypothetical protein
MSNLDPQSKKQDRSSKTNWVSPAITDLPRLTDMTLQTGGGIPGGFSIGGTQIGGSSIIP